MIAKLNQGIEFIVTAGGIGSWPAGSILASLIILPLVFAARMIGVCWISTTVLAALGIICMIIFAYTKPEERSSISLSRMMGLATALYKVPFTLKKIGFIFIIFHLLSIVFSNIILPLLFRKTESDEYDADSLVKLLLGDTAAAIITLAMYYAVTFFIHI